MLPAETEKVWRFIQPQASLSGFILIGGSALALHLRHRISEDLDLTCLEPRLPSARIDAFIQLAKETGFVFARDDDEAAVEEFTMGGLELHDYQQDFLVNGAVKVSLFTADNALTKVLGKPSEGCVQLPTLRELFDSKALVSAKRSKTRDWLDLYFLFRDQGFTLREYRDAFRRAGVGSEFEIGLSRLCSGVPQRDDEGYAHLLPNPPSVAEIKSFFETQRKEFEIQTAAETRTQRDRAGGE